MSMSSGVQVTLRLKSANVANFHAAQNMPGITSGDSVMNDSICQRIEDSEHFRELVAKRQRFATILSLIMLVVYVSFILLIAFAPAWLGTPLHSGTTVTRGIPIGIGVILISFVLTAVYVWRANGEFDRLTHNLLREVKV